MLKDKTMANHQIMDLQVVFSSVMPRAYFVQFLEDYAED